MLYPRREGNLTRRRRSWPKPKPTRRSDLGLRYLSYNSFGIRVCRLDEHQQQASKGQQRRISLCGAFFGMTNLEA